VRGERESKHGIPLTGADCMLRAFDAEIARRSGANHVSQLVLRLGPGFDPERFVRLVTQVTHAQPILRSPIVRRFFVGAPIYQLVDAPRCPLPAISTTDASAPSNRSEPFPKLFGERLNERMAPRRGELLRFDIVRYDEGRGGTDLALSWMHMLFDGSGSENFVRFLDECFRGECSPVQLPCKDEFEAPADPRPMKERGDAAVAWQRRLSSFASKPAGSLAGPVRSVPQQLRYQRIELSASETEIATQAAKQRAGFLTPMLFYLAAGIRAHHAVLRERNAVPASYVAPVAVNLRPRGSAKAIFRTHVSMLWFQALPEQVEDLGDLIAALKQQRLEIIKGGLIESAVDAMDFARFAPARLYTHMARRDFHGELSSFFFAFTGEFLQGLESFCGAPILDGFHAAPVPPSPGSCLAIHLRGGRLNATHTYQQGVMSEHEHELFRGQLESDWLG
jgi:hypothetical protein